VLPFIFRGPRVLKTADLRMFGQQAPQQRRPASVESPYKYELMFRHEMACATTPIILSRDKTEGDRTKLDSGDRTQPDTFGP